MEIFRKCAGCAQNKNRNSMLKITKKFDSSELILNPSSKVFGRSAYICNNKECIKNALKKNKLFKILKAKPDENLIRALNEE